jgi:hypothetical protein
MSRLAQLIDKRRAAEAVLYGVNMEIAMAQNQREDAHYWKDLMYAAIKARKADAEAGCYFMEQGDKDRAKVAG